MRVVVSLIMCVFFALVGPNEALACLCKPEPVRQKIKRLQKESTAIFEGTVKSVTKEKLSYRATLTVRKQWKYPATEEITVRTEGGCMAWFEVGRDYLVYAVKDDGGEFKTDVCMRTRLVEYAAEDLKRLGKPKVLRTARQNRYFRPTRINSTPVSGSRATEYCAFALVSPAPESASR